MHHAETLTRKLQALRLAMGPVLAEALADPLVVEVMVNADGAVWVERAGEGRQDSGARLSTADAERVLRLVADHAGEVVNRDHPLVSATLPVTGERFQGVSMPVSAAPCFSIRKRAAAVFTLDDYVAAAVMTRHQADILRRAAADRSNILIAGGTGAGKTTLANAILALPAFAKDRVVMIEDTAELQCAAADQLALLTKSTPPAVSMRDLVRAALRLRPDRIVIGEVRDGAALDLLKAWNTGHPGGLATLHANSAGDALTRLEDLVGEATAHPSQRGIALAIDLVAFIARAPTGRRLEAIVRVRGWGERGFELETL